MSRVTGEGSKALRPPGWRAPSLPTRDAAFLHKLVDALFAYDDDSDSGTIGSPGAHWITQAMAARLGVGKD